MPNPADNRYKIYRRLKSERIPGAIWALFVILLGIALLVLPSAAGQPISDPRSYFISAFFILVGIAFGYLMLGTRLRTTPEYIEYKGFLTKKKIEWGRIESVAVNSYGLLLVWHENKADSENESADAKRKTKLIPLHLFVKNWWELGAWEQHALGHEIREHAPHVLTEIQNTLGMSWQVSPTIPFVPIGTRIKRSLIMGLVGGGIMGLANPWAKSAAVPIFTALLTGSLIAELTFYRVIFTQNKTRFLSALIALAICTVASFSAGLWHFLVCQVVSFASSCKTGAIQLTIFISLLMSFTVTIGLAIDSLIDNRR